MVAQNYDPAVRFTPKNLEVMRFVSHQVAMAIRSKRHEVELQRYVGLLRTTFESTDDGILIVEKEGRVLATNDRFIKMWCIPDSIARTKDDERMLRFVQDQLKDPEAFILKVRALYENPELTSFDRIEFKDGRFFERFSQPFYLEDRIAGRIWSFRDVTERTRAEMALNKSERELKSIINSAKDAIFVKDLDGRYLLVNDAMGPLFHLPSPVLVGKTDQELLKDEEARTTALSDRKVLDGKIIEEEEIWTIAGDTLTFGVVKAPLKDEHGQVIGICGIARDTTERRRVEKALKDANESLNLLSSITRHDVLNQLMVIRGYSDLVRAALKDQKMLEYMDKVERATRNIRTQILFTRDFQRLGMAAPKWQSVEEMLDRALTSLEVGNRDISVDLSGLELLADPMLEKVFYNLLDNTLRHGEGATRISVTCKRQDSSMLLVYEDDGTGVKDEEKERIFERGFGRNTGLGLFLVRLILNITGIKVRENGEYGKGARFEMSVPDGTYRFREWDDEH
jgi:PAS domain S-box-containing protein